MKKLDISLHKRSGIVSALLWEECPFFKVSAFSISSDKNKLTASLRKNSREEIVPGSSPETGEIFEAVSSYLDGADVDLPLDPLDLSSLSDFAGKVLFTLREKVSRGKVISYGKLAELSGFPGASRAVGTVMSRNRYPLFFPCHRVVKSNGEAGAYGPGADLKRLLLAGEGLTFNTQNRISLKLMF